MRVGFRSFNDYGWLLARGLRRGLVPVRVVRSLAGEPAQPQFILTEKLIAHRAGRLPSGRNRFLPPELRANVGESSTNLGCINCAPD